MFHLPLGRFARAVGRAQRLTGALVGLLASTLVVAAPAAPAGADPVVTPGDFTGYGFDQCQAPSQRAMNVWRNQSPYLAVGIYISGDSRGCREQTNLSATWVSNQLARGWRLLPITLGPQASCHPGFPRYGNDPVIDPNPGLAGTYPNAYAQGTAEARKSVVAAQALGIVAGSTLWYDLEGFTVTNTRCRESALQFLSGWTAQLRLSGYVSGVYSSAGSGIKMLDDARVLRPGVFALPDRIWIARWDGLADTSTSYIREDGWRPGGRMKQYRGGHNETYGGVTINIDTNFLDLGAGSVPQPAESHCGGVPVDLAAYGTLTRGTTKAIQIRALQCLLTEQGSYAGPIDGGYGAATIAAVKAWQTAHGFVPGATWRPKHWTALLAQGDRLPVKFGMTGAPVFRLQRALTAATGSALTFTGVFDAATEAAVRSWQSRVRQPATGVVSPKSWGLLQRGTR